MSTKAAAAPLTNDIGPRGFLPDSKSPFFMSRGEFLAVQLYCDAGTRLPKTGDDLVVKLGILREDVGEFADMLTAYGQVSDHCADFKDNTFRQTVQLSNEVADYSTQAISTYYPALLTIIDAWNSGVMPPDTARKKLDAVLGLLRTVALEKAQKANAVQQKVHAFVEQTKSDQANLEPVKQRYTKKYEGNSGMIKSYMDDLDFAKQQIDYWNNEYQHDVTVAATSATYAWVYPVGTIAAATVAGIYGKKATDALDEIHRYQDRVAAASENLRKALKLMVDLKLADTSLASILDALKAALPVLQKMEGIWTSLAADIGLVVEKIDKNISQAPAIIKDLGVNAAIEQWKVVVTAARNYAANAFVTVTTEADIKSKPAALFLVTKAS